MSEKSILNCPSVGEGLLPVLSVSSLLCSPSPVSKVRGRCSRNVPSCVVPVHIPVGVHLLIQLFTEFLESGRGGGREGERLPACRRAEQACLPKTKVYPPLEYAITGTQAMQQGLKQGKGRCVVSALCLCLFPLLGECLNAPTAPLGFTNAQNLFILGKGKILTLFG